MADEIMDSIIEEKRNFAEENSNGNEEVLEEVLEQIQHCEELYTPLSTSDILNMLKLNNEKQVEIYARGVKFA